MKKFSMGLAVIAVAGLAFVNTAHAQSTAPQSVTGRLADATCAGDGKTDDGDGDACALSCAKRGETMVVIANDAMYTITGAYTDNKNEKMIPFVAKNVVVTGKVVEKDGKKTIEVATMEIAKK